ncbi:MAG: thioredoxin domain-containing protein [Gemmatimonadetes bacterium]|nr:thioredoxin domain-containing protein [Gemmatimonadota bacterium]
MFAVPLRTLPLIPLPLLVLACVSERGPITNRMAHAGTNYLSRAARHPVSWQPWGKAAFALAAQLDRPVLLFVGADDCRGCAAMDQEAYDNPALAGLINSLFVPVRVDRDERPDVAQRYQAAVQTLAGLRGYPLTVFLTPDGSAFFGGTYFPADDPMTGRGLMQILPDVARSYRDQRQFIIQQAALVRQLAMTRSGGSHGVLQPRQLEFEMGTMRGGVAVAAASGAVRRNFPATRAVGALLSDYGRMGDTTSLGVARAALDRMLDSAPPLPADAPEPQGARDDPPTIVRAGLLRDLAQAWAVTGEARYGDAARRLAGALAGELGGGRRTDRAVFTDREAFVIGSVLEAAGAVGDSAAEAAARMALDSLLVRVYTPGWGVRHAVVGSVQGLLQDQMQVAGACLAAHAATGDTRYLAVARDIAAVLDRDFADPLGGYFDAARPDPAAPAPEDRTKHVLDDLLPGANAWAARVLLQLAAATDEPRYRRRAEATLEAFAQAIGGEGIRAATYLEVARQVLGRR